MADNKNTSHDAAIGWSLLLLVIFCILAIFWYFQGPNIANAIRWVRIAEMEVAQIFVGDDYMIMDGNKPIAPLGNILKMAKKIDRAKLNEEALNFYGHTYLGIIAIGAMYPLRYFFSALLFLMGFWAIYFGPKSRYRTKLDLNNLIKRQAASFPALAPFVTFNPSNQPPRAPGAPVPAELPSFAEALGPEEWVAYFEVPVPDGKVDEDGASRGLARQLGPPWRGPMHMEPYRQVLLAAYCLKSARKRSEADDMLGELSRAWTFESGLKIKSKLLSDAR
ncbi:MAG: type IV secretion system protein, partial [Pseudomonadota bacterium]